MNRTQTKGEPQTVRCAIYTRKSTDEGLDRDFNSLDAQREAAEAYIASQRHEGWICLPERYDDGGFTGANLERPGLRRLLADLEAGQIDCIVVYKVDRLSRSLLDFSRLVERFDKHRVSFVSVTQLFNTSHSMGRLTLNILLSFAQFEREIISERTRDKMGAARRKGKWAGGRPILGYDVVDRKLVVHSEEAFQVRQIFELYREKPSLIGIVQELFRRGWTSKRYTTKRGEARGGRPIDKGNLHYLLTNVIYRGQVRHHREVFPGEHVGIVDPELFERVQELLRENARADGLIARNRFSAPLTGLLRCVACQCSMPHTHSVKRGTRYRYYVCLKAQKRGWNACPAQSVPAAEIERFVIEQVRNLGRDSVGLTSIETAAGQSPLADNAPELEPVLAALERGWDALSLLEEAQLLHLLLERVDYDGRSGEISITFKPSGVQALAAALAQNKENRT